MIGTWGVDIEESNNFILIYIVIFMMTYAVANVSYEAISKITSDNLYFVTSGILHGL